MSASVREFLETHPLHTKFHTPSARWWRGKWPEAVEAPCGRCGEKRSFRLWPSKLVGFAPQWGVYMLNGTCDTCAHAVLLFWVEVNEREGWMLKAGQLPAPAPVAVTETEAWM